MGEYTVTIGGDPKTRIGAMIFRVVADSPAEALEEATRQFMATQPITINTKV